MLGSGLINVSSLGKFNGYLDNIVVNNKVKNLIESIKSNSKIKKNYCGIYTSEESDAAKLAYAAGGFWKGEALSEIHDNTPGSGYYYHFHDFTHSIHVWYGVAA